MLHEKYTLLNQILGQNGFSTSEVKQISYGIQFAVAKNDWTGIMRIYQNTEGTIKYDYSQLNNPGYTQEIMQLVEFANPDFIDKPGIGCDESGKGDYFGPLVCAAVCVNKDQMLRLKSLGVRDSKSISDARIERLADDIKKITGTAWSVFVLTPEQYNVQYALFISNGKKLNELVAWAHAQTVSDLLQRIPARRIIIDQFAEPSLIRSALFGPAEELEIKITPKAEIFTPVACASILARAEYVASLRALQERFRMDFPKGASSQVIQAGREFIHRHGMEKLSMAAKLHFKTTQNISPS
ncbi:ribonuclease HIII [candidate division KSB1 bacterium]|nr:ribonuclease HIII [candidate division KSB1 bacterium]